MDKEKERIERMCCISVGRSHPTTISPGCPMVNQRHDPRPASRWPAIKRLTEAKCCVFYKTRRNISLFARPTCRRVPKYTWVHAKLTTNWTRKHEKFIYAKITVFWAVTPCAFIDTYFGESSLWVAGCHTPDDTILVFLRVSLLDDVLDSIA